MIAQLIPHIFFSCPPFKVEAGSFFRDPELLRVIGIKIALNDKYYVYHLSEKCRDGRGRTRQSDRRPIFPRRLNISLKETDLTNVWVRVGRVTSGRHISF